MNYDNVVGFIFGIVLVCSLAGVTTIVHTIVKRKELPEREVRFWLTAAVVALAFMAWQVTLGELAPYIWSS